MAFLGQLEVFFLSLAKIQILYCIGNQFVIKFYSFYDSPYINAPQDDIYTFALLSDDGSTLVIDGEQVIDNDGPHGPREVVGQKALAKGYHPIEIRYFDQNGGQLKMKVSGNDGKEIPFTHLYAH